jgi:hypothetical protein
MLYTSSLDSIATSYTNLLNSNIKTELMRNKSHNIYIRTVVFRLNFLLSLRFPIYNYYVQSFLPIHFSVLRFCTSVSPAKKIIPPLLHIHLSPPHEVCDCSDQAAHYHNLGPKLGASLLTRHSGWKQKRERKKGLLQKLIKNYQLGPRRIVVPTNIVQIVGKYLEICHDRFLLNPCLFTFNFFSPFDLMQNSQCS